MLSVILTEDYNEKLKIFAEEKNKLQNINGVKRGIVKMLTLNTT